MGYNQERSSKPLNVELKTWKKGFIRVLKNGSYIFLLQLLISALPLSPSLFWHFLNCINCEM